MAYSPPPAGADLYDDAPMPGKPDAAPDEKKEHQDDQASAVLPKSFFQGKDLTPGTQCKVEIERVMDDQVQVAYVPHDESKEDESGEGEAPPPAPPAMAGNEPSMMD